MILKNTLPASIRLIIVILVTKFGKASLDVFIL
jgi:hypothetical protein